MARARAEELAFRAHQLAIGAHQRPSEVHQKHSQGHQETLSSKRLKAIRDLQRHCAAIRDPQQPLRPVRSYGGLVKRGSTTG